MSSKLQFNYAEGLLNNGKHIEFQDRIKQAQYRVGRIKVVGKFLHDLRFMGPPHHWHYSNRAPANEEGEIYNSITGYDKNGIVTLYDVAKGIIDEYGRMAHHDSYSMLYKLAKASKWYEKFFVIRAYFDRRLLTPLWVRNWGDGKSFYITNGASLKFGG